MGLNKSNRRDVSVNSSASSQSIHLELYRALEDFVRRQQLVVYVVTELGVSPESLSRGVAAWHDRIPQIGVWDETWEYFFHGGGCELRHLRTGEPIDLNGPDPLAFGSLSFIHHLEWRLKSENELPELHAFVTARDLLAVLDLIDELVSIGVIAPDRHLLPFQLLL